MFETTGNEWILVMDSHGLVLPQIIEAGKHIEITYYFPTVNITTDASVKEIRFGILVMGDEGDEISCAIDCQGDPLLGLKAVQGFYQTSPFVDENPAMEWVYENGEIVGMKVSGNLRVPMHRFLFNSPVTFDYDGNHYDYTLKEVFTRENPIIMVVK